MIRSLLVFLLALPPMLGAADPIALLAEARAARETKDFARAESLANEVIALVPNSGEAFLDRAFTFLAQKKRADAAASFKAAVEADPTNPKCYLYRGDLAYRMIEKNYAACEVDYATVLKLDPTFPGLRAYTAELYLYQKNPSRVVAEAAMGLALEPTSPIHRINLAHGLAFSGHMAAAKQLYLDLAAVDIGHGRKGAAFALGDFGALTEHGINYPEIPELTTFLKNLAQK